VSGLGLLETVVVLLPVLVVAAVAYGVWVWTRRRGHL
jgi:nitrate reductase NapE component